MYETLFRHALFPAYETLVKRRSTAMYVAQYEQGQWLKPAALQRLQLDKLNALLAHAWAEVPFLQRHWREHGCQPGALASVGELARYPLLTKTQITANYGDMVARNWRGKTLSKTTGGSTGDPFRFEYTMDVYARRTAVMWRGYGWAGARLGTRTAYLWGSGPPKAGWPGLKDRLYHNAFNRRFFDAFGLSDTNVDQYINDITAYRPKALVGYVAPVVLLARRMLQTGRQLSGLRGVITGAEALYGAERRDIEAAFGAPVFNTYGTREVMLLAAECAQHNGLHLSADHLLVETVTDDGRVLQGESGAVAVTDLHNLGMPMVRYLNGDRATYAAAPCACGRGLPLLHSLDGRVLDMIHTPDGRHLPGEFFAHTMVEFPEVRRWQLVQTASDALEYRVIAPPGWPQERHALLLARLRAKCGEAVALEVRVVEAIADSASGKRRLTVALPNRPQQ